MATKQASSSQVKSIDLVWIVVDDFQKALKFYTEVIGLKVLASYGEWAELAGHDGGACLGISGYNGHCPIAAGKNAVLTMTVDDLQAAVAEIQKKGAQLVGGVEEVPGHVRLQLFVDPDGNHGQLVQKLDDHQKR